MLNRRSLRIKVMQFLYALERQKGAFQLIAREQSGAHFDPDINTDEEQDIQALNISKKEVFAGFDQSLKKGPKEFTELAPDIKDAIEDGLLTYQNLLKEAEKSGLKQLKDETERVSNSYNKILWLPKVWKDIIITEWNKLVDTDKNVGLGFRNLELNPVIKAIEKNTQLSNTMNKNKLNWDSDIVVGWLRKLVKKDELYQQYSGKRRLRLRMRSLYR